MKKLLTSITGFLSKDLLDFTSSGKAPPSDLGLNNLKNGLLSHPKSNYDSGLGNRHQTILESYQQLAAKNAKLGLVDGPKGIPASDSIHSCEAEKNILAGYEEAHKKVKSVFESYHQQVNHDLKEVRESLAIKDTDDIKQKQLDQAKDNAKYEVGQKVPILSTQWKLRKHERSVEAVVSAIEEKHRQLTEEKQGFDSQYEDLMTHIYGQVPPIKKWMDSKRFFWILVGGLLAIEFGANFKAFQAYELGGTNITSLILGFVLAVLQAGGAKKAGSGFRHRRFLRGLGFLIVTITLCFWISYFRFMVEETLADKLMNSSINFIIGFATVIIAYLHAKNEDYFSVLRKRQNASTRLKKLDTLLSEIKADHEKREKEAVWRVTDQAYRKEKAKKESNEKKIRQYELTIEKLGTSEKDCQSQLESMRDQALMDYREWNQNARKRAGHDPVKRWEDDKPLTPLSNVIKIASVLLWLSFGLTGCISVEEPVYLEVIYDQTSQTYSQDTELMTDYIMEYLSIDRDDGKWGKVTVTLSTISDVSNPVIYEVVLEASENYLTRSEVKHNKKPDIFRKELKQAMDTITAPSEEKGQSYIHRNLHGRLHSLSKLKGRRTVLLWSDLILNHPPINFYHFQEDPSLLYRSTDSLMTLMEQGYGLPDLSGVHLVNIHEPSKANDALYEGCKHMFAYQWEHHGMTVEFKTTIPNKGVIFKPKDMATTTSYE